MSDPHGTREVSVTIKVPESKRYAGDAPWLVFYGSTDSIIEQIAQAFQLDADGQSLIELTMQAQGIANTFSRNPDVGLGAKTVGKSTPSSAQKPQEAAQAPASEAADTEPEDGLLAALQGAQSRAELKTIRAENQQAFNDDPKYLDAWKARGREVK